MTRNNKVTVWHAGKAAVFDCIIGNISLKDAKNGIKQYGYHDDSEISVRIFTDADLEADISDCVRLGAHSGNADRGSDFKITEIRDNRRGASPHYKIICGK